MKFLLSLFIVLIWISPAQAYDLPYIGAIEDYTIQEGDTMVHLARDKGFGFVELRAANPFVDPWLPDPGTQIILPYMHLLPDAPREGIVINLPEMRLYSFVGSDEKGAEPITYPLGVGREGLETPIGSTTVTRKTEGPTWRPTPRMREENPDLPAVVEPGEDNPLGSHALYLGWPQYLIHGTNKPYGIGRRVSSGCIRLYPEHIPKLYEQTPVGTKVTVVNQAVKLAWIDDKLYMEAHPDLEQAIEMEQTGEVYEARIANDDLKRIIAMAGESADKLHWPRIRNAIRHRSGYPIMIARREGSTLSAHDKRFSH